MKTNVRDVFAPLFLSLSFSFSLYLSFAHTLFHTRTHTFIHFAHTHLPDIPCELRFRQFRPRVKMKMFPETLMTMQLTEERMVEHCTCSFDLYKYIYIFTYL